MVKKSLFEMKESLKSSRQQFRFVVLSILFDKYFTCKTFCINLIL